VPERSDFFEGDAPAADKVQAFLANALEASGGSANVAGALVPWICDALLSNHSVKAYGRDFLDFVRQMQAQGVTPLEVTADHVKTYKRSLLEAGMTSATVVRRLSVRKRSVEPYLARGVMTGSTSPDSMALTCRGRSVSDESGRAYKRPRSGAAPDWAASHGHHAKRLPFAGPASRRITPCPAVNPPTQAALRARTVATP
jgi:hypothetical protein